MRNWQHSIISGGASGLGLGLAERLLRVGGRVSVIDLALSEAVARQLTRAAEQGLGSWRFFRADLTDEQAVVTALSAANAAFGAPDLGINCAGILINRTLAETDSAAFQRVVNVNLVGSFHFSRAVLPLMKPGARLALIASIAGLTSSYGYAAYGASKFGVVGLATTLRYEYEPLGIGISCICPPEVKTPMVAAERSPGNASAIALALEDLAGSLEPDYACDAILAGINAGKWQIVPGIRGKLTVSVARYLPGFFFAFMKHTIKRLMRKYGDQRP